MDFIQLSKNLPELQQIAWLVESAPASVRVRVIESVPFNGVDLPIHAFEIGPKDPELPVFLLTGGVHGLERIGTQVVTSYMKTLFEQLRWDKVQRGLFKSARLIIVPLVNPVGMMLRSRSNGRGVDLMRNAPVESAQQSRFPLVEGHRIGPFLAWYRGHSSEDGTVLLEREAAALEGLIREQVLPSQVAVSLDVHSGFGTVDRLWFPYAKSREPFPGVAELYQFSALLDRTYENHIYRVEPQSLNYTTHGDLWDYFYDIHRQQSNNERKAGPQKVFLPLALELGSWLWVKKNPRQLFSMLGAFNPLIRHRYKRILRRHINLLEFMMRATAFHKEWSQISPKKRQEIERKAVDRWFSAVIDEISTHAPK